MLPVFSESESRLSTGRDGEEDDDGELIRIYELLVSERVDRLQIEKRQHTPGTEPARTAHASVEKGLASPMAVVAVRPGELLRVVPVERNGSTTGATGESIDLLPALQQPGAWAHIDSRSGRAWRRPSPHLEDDDRSDTEENDS